LDLVEATSGGQVRRHPWEEARFRFFRRILDRAKLLRDGAELLDVGAGDAWFASRLAAESGVVPNCWDSGYEARPIPVPAGVRLSAREPEGRFEVVLALDVLEHVDDDAGFLGKIVRDRLASGGALLLSVPAWPSLYSAHDAALRHVRRYTPHAARALVEGAGLELVRGGGLFHSLLLSRLVQKTFARPDPGKFVGVGDWNAPAWITGLVGAALALDGAASALFASLRLEVPGLSWWALCRKP
jgi:hypothetical protein